MPLIRDRSQVLQVYERAATHGWVIPAFCTENLTTTEAVLAAAKEHGDKIGHHDLPVTIAITNLYPHRPQAVNYSHTRRWDLGLRLFLADLRILTSPGSPFADLDVMVHLDHIQPRVDGELLEWDMTQFSSIMFDASSLPFEENMEATSRFVHRHGDKIVIEGACDEIVDAGSVEKNDLTSPERAQEYMKQTRVDFIVANLGTEHRASQVDLRYRGDVAREIKSRIGTRIVLHGCSSVSNEQIRDLFADGICKVNMWTALERDSSPAVLEGMVRNAGKVAGPAAAQQLVTDGFLGPRVDLESKADLAFFTTCYRQGIVFEQMKLIAGKYFELWHH